MNQRRRNGNTRGSYCCVPGCKNTTLGNKNVSWHKLPLKKKDLLNLWIKQINRSGRTGFTRWTPKNFHRICGIHFNLSGRKTSADLVPKFHLPNSKADQKVTSNEGLLVGQPDQGPKMEPSQITTEIEIECKKECENDDLYSLHENIVMEPNLCQENTNPWNTEHFSLDLENSNNENKMSLDKDYVIKDLQKEIDRLKGEIHELKKENVQKNMEIKNLKLDLSINKDKAHRKCGCLFSSKNIVNDQKLLKFYTNFDNKQLYDNFSAMIHPQYVLARDDLAQHAHKRQKSTSLDYNNQLLMVLTYLRLGLLEDDLAYRFNVSQTTVSRTLTFWLPFLCKQLEQELGSSRVTLGCTEIFVQTPSEFRVQATTYTNSKSCTTAKGLVAISPNGFVSFVSDFFGESTTKQCAKGKHVMADRGSLIDNEAISNIPSFLKGRTQSDKTDDEKTKDTVSLRAHIDRVIRRIKTFRILKYVNTNASNTTLNSIWKVCCYLTNFTAPPIMDTKDLSKD